MADGNMAAGLGNTGEAPLEKQFELFALVPLQKL